MFESPEVVPRSVSAMNTQEGLTLTLRVLVRKYSHSVGTQTDA